MNINYKYNIQNFEGSSYKIKNRINENMQNSDLDKLTQAALGELKSMNKREEPSYNMPLASYFDIPASNQQAWFMIEKRSEDQKSLSVAVKSEDSEKTITRPLGTGTTEEITQYIENIDSQKITQAIQEISRKVDR